MTDINQHHIDKAKRALHYPTELELVRKVSEIVLAEQPIKIDKSTWTKLNGELMPRDKALDIWDNKKSTHSMWFKLKGMKHFDDVICPEEARLANIFHSPHTECEYELRPNSGLPTVKISKQVKWSDIPTGVLLQHKLVSPPVILNYRGCNNDLVGAEEINSAGFPVTRAYAPHVLGLAPEYKQPWLLWQGGNCPVPKGVIVDVEYRNTSGQWTMLPDMCDWRHAKTSGDIIAYRINRLQEGYELV